ncbi:M16 family metallopeptidase [Streptomyces sp. NPDC017435]|uniref:M16 family metallopeptidase n=1 Tax=Streptomyces sp. NPDC017435 TaxID=3364995 RepID=UPI0037BA2771
MTPSAPAPAVGPLPPLGPHQPFELPPHTDLSLPSGLRAVIVRADSTPMAEIRLLLPLPVHRADPATASVLAALLTGNTALRTAAGIEAALGREGSLLSAAWTGSGLALSASVPAHALRWTLDLIAEFLAHPHYSRAACEAVARRLAERAHGTLAAPAVAAQEALRARCFPDAHHTRRPGPDALGAVTSEQVTALHTAAVVPRGAFLVVVGAVDPQRTTADVTAAFASWTDTGPPPDVPGPVWSGGGIGVVHHRGAAQAQLALAAPAPPRTDPSFPALSLGNCLFGGFFSSRLMRQLREKSGLVYQVESTIDDVVARPAILINCATAVDTAPDTLHEIREQLDQLHSRPPSPREIDAAREYITGITYIGQTSQSGLASTLVGVLGYGMSTDWLRDFPEQLRAVTAAQVTEVFEQHYRADAFTGVAVGAPGPWEERVSWT